MKIDSIRRFRYERFLFVEIRTDTGLTGVGEAGFWGYPEAADGAIEAFTRYLVGQDPLKIEHHSQYMYRNSHFMGGSVTGAIAAIDIALWDIAGKHYQAPIYELLGGRCRDKVRVYAHCRRRLARRDGGERPRNGPVGASAAVRFCPLVDGFHNWQYARVMAECVDRVAAVREAVGNDVDLCVEVHRRLNPTEARQLARELEPFRIFFLEDPIIPDSVQSMSELAKSINVPVATGERFTTIFEFREMLAAGGVAYARPDVCLAGGITQSKKIAALAESFHVGIIPHNPLGPVSTAACVQVDACIPNFVLQEYTGDDIPPKRDMVIEPLKLEGGYLRLPETPGVGVELSEAVLSGEHCEEREIETHLRYDGSVADY